MSIHVLVVEDNPELATMWAYLFQRYGYTVQTAYNSIQALAAYQEKSAKLVLVDYYLPGDSGVDLLQRIKDMPDTPRPVSVLLTSNPYFKPEAYDDLVDAFILKPASPDQLMHLVWRYLPPVAS